VEDDPDIAQMLVLMLSRAGYHCDVASNGEIALQLLMQRSYAAMTLDVLLPDQSGITLIRKLRAEPQYEKFPIVVVSVYMDDGELAINSKFAAVDWLSKPIDENRLIAAVRRSQTTLHDKMINILHVEDDADLHHIVAMLGRDVANFDIAHTLAQARQKLQRVHYDLVILDIGLPDGSGWSLLPEINAMQPAPQVIVLSGAEFSAEQQSRVTQTLVKSPTSIAHLLSTIKKDIENSNFKPREI
jgi:DNA-binding response OmpR family regulator